MKKTPLILSPVAEALAEMDEVKLWEAEAQDFAQRVSTLATLILGENSTLKVIE